MKKIILQLSVVAVVGCLLISSSHAAPPDKEKLRTKLKPVLGEKEGSKITAEERQFLKEVEAKFKINTKETNDKTEIKKILEKKTKGLKLPFPAVIAIEIVNDTTPDGKGKRTIDANLGYGYKTNNGYFYQKFGGSEDKGKFMVYPYSQHDIPPPQNTHFSGVYTNKQKGEKTYVDIQPSQAFQLVPVDSNERDEHNSYNTNDVVSYLRTKYENIQAVETPPPPQYSQTEDYYQHSTQTESPTTYYSTYNDHGQLSSFSGHFPSVMSNYYVNPSQLFGNSHQYQDYGGSQQDEYDGPKRVIPVFILRIPSSQISHEHASTFNQLNLQSLVSQYLAQLQPYVLPKPVASQQYYTRPVYSTGSGDSHYSVPQTQYVSSDYSQTQYAEDDGSDQHIQYVPQYRTRSRLPSAHMTFSQVYSTLSKEHQQPGQYEHSSDNSQNLPISENYPDHRHTKVVFKPQYTNDEQDQGYEDEHASGYSTATPESVSQAYTPASHHESQISIIHNGHAVQEETQGRYDPAIYAKEQEDSQKEEEDEQERYSASQEEVQTPYNYHAHPFPKRHTKSTGSEAKSPAQRNKRPLRSGTDTAVTTKL